MADPSRKTDQPETITHKPEVPPQPETIAPERVVARANSPVCQESATGRADSPVCQEDGRQECLPYAAEPGSQIPAPVSIPGYKILSVLGRGGMGVVYQARQTKLNRIVALKMILAGAHAGPDVLNRFRTEAEAIAQVQHPNIVQVFEVGEHDGLPFFSLEFCGGGSLEQKLQGNPLPPTEAAKLIETLARAIHAAHQKGIIHRDLKPANVLFSEQDSFGWHAQSAAMGVPSDSSTPFASHRAPLQGVPPNPKITDFGLAKKLDEAGHTATGAVMGTPSYMAPEQAGGLVKELGPATDIHALGALLYECLTGRPPFKAATPLDTMMLVLKEEPVSPRDLNARVPRDLGTICLKCLQKSPAKRYTTADDLAEDLRRFQAGEPIAARPISSIEKGLRWAKRKPAHATALVVSAVATLVLLLGGWWFSNELRMERNNVQAERDNTQKAWDAEQARAAELVVALKTAQTAEQKARAEEARAKESELAAKTKEAEAQAIISFFENHVLAPTRPAGLGGGLAFDVTLRSAIDAAESRIASAFKDQPLVEASIRATLGHSYWLLGENNMAIRQHQQAIALRQANLGSEHSDTLESMHQLAAAYRQAGQPNDAIPLFESVLALRRKVVGEEHPKTLSTINSLAVAYQDAGRLKDAIPLFEEMFKRRQGNVGPEHPDTLTSMNNLAFAYQRAGRVNDALPLFEETLGLAKATLGPEHPDTLSYMNRLGGAYRDAGRLKEALPLLVETLNLRKAKLGPEHPNTLASMNNLGLAYSSAGRSIEAVAIYEETIKLMKAKLGPDHPNTLTSMNNLAFAYRRAGRLQDALPLLEQTLKLRRAKQGPDHPNTMTTMHDLAVNYQVAGRLADAVPLYEETLKRRRATLGVGHPDTQKTIQALATAYRAINRTEEAMELEKLLEPKKDKRLRMQSA